MGESSERQRWRRVARGLGETYPDLVGVPLPLGNTAAPYDEGASIQLTTMPRSQTATVKAYDDLAGVPRRWRVGTVARR